MLQFLFLRFFFLNNFIFLVLLSTPYYRRSKTERRDRESTAYRTIAELEDDFLSRRPSSSVALQKMKHFFDE